MSGADCRLLIQWLDDEVPITAILTTIDRVSDKRRKKRVRTRLSLNACKGTLNRLLGKAAKPKATQTVEITPIEQWLKQVYTMPVSKDLIHARQQLWERCQRHIQNNSHTLSQMASELINAGRLFQESAWEAAFDEHIQLQAKAEAELSPLRTLLHGQAWKDAVEEVMRDQVRQRYSLVNAQNIWNALNQ